MDCKATTHNLLERMLLDASVEPRNIPIALLRAITNGFSDDQKIGSGGFAVVYKGELQNGTVAVKKLVSKPAQWKKDRCIGSGSFAQVYLGVNSENGKFCAIKEVQVILDDRYSKKRLKQLNQEIYMLKQLSHPNIVQYYGSDLTDDALSIYLEYMSKGSIQKLLGENGPFKESMIRNCTRQILCGLAYLHGRKTFHRDIKGANILVGPNGEVKLADFGVAKIISSLAEIHSFQGSAHWMSPEVIINSIRSGESYNLSVDIWSLGCTVIEMATAMPPWHPLEPQQAMCRIATTTEIPKIPDSLSEEGKDFLQLCLNRDPASRPSATQLMGHPFVQDRPWCEPAKSSALGNKITK